MKRFIFFVLGFVLAFAILINIGCASGFEKNLMSNWEKEMTHEDTQSKKTQKDLGQVGWLPQDKDGYLWEYHARGRGRVIQVVARCSYTFIRIRGVEKWNGTYYNILDDFGKGDQFDSFVTSWKRLDGLSGCVRWVEHFLYGDKFI